MNWDSSSGGGGGAARHGFRRRQQGIPDKPNQVSREVLSSTDDGPHAPPHIITAPFGTDYANPQLGDLNPDYDHHRRERRIKEEETMSMNSGLFAGLGMTKQPNGRRGQQQLQQQTPTSPIQQQHRPEEISPAFTSSSSPVVENRFPHHQPHSPPPQANNSDAGGGGFRSQQEKQRKNQEVAGKITGARAWTEQSSAAHKYDSDQLNHQQRQLSAYGGYNGNNNSTPQYSTGIPHNNNNNSTTPSRTPYPPLNQSSDFVSPAHQNYSKTAPGGGGGRGENYGSLSPSNISEPQRTRTPEPLPRGYQGNDRAQQALDQQSNYNPAFAGGVGSNQYGGGPSYSNGAVRNLQPIDQSPLPSPAQKVLVPVVTIGPNCPVELVNQVHGNFNESQKSYLPTVVYATSSYTTY